MDAITSHGRSTFPVRRSLGLDRWVSIRPIERSDASALSDFYARLSRESRRRRFLSCADRVDPLLVRQLLEVPGLVGILREPGPHDGAIVAHASIHPAGPDAVEVAFAVADDLQGRGIGRALVAAALGQARGAGATTATATLVADNLPMRHLLLDAGAPVVADRIDTGVEEIVLDLSAA
jgi:acetyltransferase